MSEYIKIPKKFMVFWYDIPTTDIGNKVLLKILLRTWVNGRGRTNIKNIIPEGQSAESIQGQLDLLVEKGFIDIVKDNVVVCSIESFLSPAANEQESIESTCEELLTFWNSQGNLMKHSKSTFMRHKNEVKSILKETSLIDIKDAVKNYSFILRNSGTDKKYYYSHSWSLVNFLRRGKDQFLSENTPLVRLVDWKWKDKSEKENEGKAQRLQ